MQDMQKGRTRDDQRHPGARPGSTLFLLMTGIIAIPAWATDTPSETEPDTPPPAVAPDAIRCDLAGFGGAGWMTASATGSGVAGSPSRPLQDGGQDPAPGKFTLVDRYCTGVAGAQGGPAAARPAPRAQQLALYDTGYRGGRLSAPEGPVAPSTGPGLPPGAVLLELPLAPPGAGAPEAQRVSAVPSLSPPGVERRKNTATQRILAQAQTLNAAAERHDIDPLLLHAIAHVESRHNADAVSPAGARGLMQVMPATARRFGLLDPQRELMAAPKNVEVSAAYLKVLQKRFGNDLPLVLAAYNAGEGAVERYGRRIPNFPETRDYVAQVLRAYRALRETVAAQRSSSPLAAAP